MKKIISSSHQQVFSTMKINKSKNRFQQHLQAISEGFYQLELNIMFVLNKIYENILPICTSYFFSFIIIKT